WELSSGVFLNDSQNADSPIWSARRRRALIDILDKFDSGGYANDARGFVKDLIKKVLLKRKSAMGLRTIPDQNVGDEEERVEIRSQRSPEVAKEFALIAKLYAARIRYLKTVMEPIKVSPDRPRRDITWEAQHFRDYVTQSQMDVGEYLPYIGARYSRELI